MFVKAYINHGRWVTDCPQCNSAELTPPGMPRMICRECGFSERLQFPKNLDEIQTILQQRPLLNQNWKSGETIADLRIENAVHQLPSGIEVAS